MTNAPPVPAAMMGRLGSHLAISLGIAMAIAGATSLLRGADRSADQAALVSIADAATPVVAGEGKFIDRMSLAAGENRLADRPFTPAILIMPMVANWPEAVAMPAQAVPPTQLRSAAAELVPLPPRRDRSLAENRMAAATLPAPVLPSVEAPRPGETSAEASWTRIVTAPAVKVAEVVSGTAGVAQAAGSWTLNQASGLLPRW